MEQINTKERIILGIDPGTAVMGYGLVKETGSKIELISLGVVKMEKIDDHMLKLQRIFEKTVALLLISFLSLTLRRFTNQLSCNSHD